MDGTLATAPRLFYKIVTLHAFVLGVMLPLVFGLLPNRDGNTYIRFLSLVKEKSESVGFTISPQRIMQDFEKGLTNACPVPTRVPRSDCQGVLLPLRPVSVAENPRYRTIRELQRERCPQELVSYATNDAIRPRATCERRISIYQEHSTRCTPCTRLQ